MAGGHATHAGIAFQNNVAAWVAVHILAAKPISAINDDSYAIPISFQLEATTPVDDIVVSTQNGGQFFLNVKTTVSSSKDIKSPLSSVFDQFVRQWLFGVSDKNLSGELRVFDAQRDRLVLILQAGRAEDFITSLNTVLQRIRDRLQLGPFEEIATTKRQADIYQTCQELVRYHWKRQLGSEINDAELLRFLSVVRITAVAIDGPPRDALYTLLEQSVTGSESSARQALVELIKIAGEYSTRRSGGDARAIRDILRTRKILLIEEPQYHRDIAKLEQITSRTLESLNHYGYIEVDHTRRITLQRSCTNSLVEAVKNKSLLLIGDPGSGKSGALQAAAQELLNHGHSVLVLAVDQLSASSLNELQAELGLDHPVVDILSAWHPSTTPILFVDALDASRGGVSERAISQLLRAVMEKAPHWHLVASIRKFDLRYGAKYQGLFVGGPVNNKFSDPEFRDVAHLNIPQLTDDEIFEISLQWPALSSSIWIGDESFKKLLRSPFNLHLLATILARTSENSSFAKTQLDILQQYWLYRVDGSTPAEGLRHSRVLHSLVDSMVTRRKLFADSNCVDPALIDDLAELLRRGVLFQPQNSNRVFFSHHVLFDFALAKLNLLADGAATIRTGLTRPDDDMLLIAPAAMLALRILWADDLERKSFWNLALDLAAADEFGAFARSLPARVAAEATSNVIDVAPLIEALDARCAIRRDAALFLIKHLFSVLFSQVVVGIPELGNESDPWCAIAKSICEKAIKDVIWPMKAVIGQWTAKEQNPTFTQMSDLGMCSRLMLDAGLGSDIYDDGAISSAISGIIRTFQCDADKSDEALRKLLNPDRVAIHGHRELFWLAQGFRQVAEHRPMLASALLRSVYTTPLPSAEEITSLSQSRILGLTSNKRQDFEGVRYLLDKQISWFLVHSVEYAATALQYILSVAGENEKIQKIYSEEAIIAGQRFFMCPDHSCVWWATESEHHYDFRATLLDELVKALVEVSEDNSRSDFSRYAILLLQETVFACSVAAFLKAIARSRSPNIPLAVDFLASPAILSSIDTSFLAGELLKKVHSKLSNEDMSRIEPAIESLTDQNTKARLIGCLDASLIVDPALRALRESFERTNNIPQNIPPFKLESGWGASDDNWWLKSEGVEVDEPISKSILEAIALVDTKNLPDDRDSALMILAASWPNVQNLANLLESNQTIHDQLQSKGRDALAEACEQAAMRSSNAADLTKFPDIRRFINLCLLPTLRPLPVYDKETEDQFERSASWGRPSPRIQAAEALMSFARANEITSEKDNALILSLARDPAVAVRHTVLARSNVVSVTDPDLSRALATIAFDEEKNVGVIKFFLGAFHNFLGADVDWSAKKILDLDSRLSKTIGERRDDLTSHLAGLVLRLWLTWDIEAARNRLNEWADSSLDHIGRIDSLLIDMRQLINFGDPKEGKTKDEAIRAKSRILFSRIVENLASNHEALLKEAIVSGKSDARLIECTNLLHTAANQLYFGSGAYDLSKSNNQDEAMVTADVRRRFLSEYRLILSRLARIPYPSVTHPILETIEAFIQDDPDETLDLLLEALRTGGKEGGYAFESMGADLVVKLVRRFLADYTSLIANTPRYRQGIVEALDLFANTGWPEARKLVYTLPEMLR